MNRLIIIGNGFDIAHNLKTKYSDFIAHYWQQVNETNYSDDFISFGVAGYILDNCHSLKDVVNYLGENLGERLSRKNYSPDFFHKNNSAIKVHNEFFIRINQKYDNANWVDIEMEYFESLKRILNRQINTTEDKFEEESFEKILKLNNEIAQIAKSFETYLVKNVVPNIKTHYNNDVAELFSNEEIYQNEIDEFYDEFPRKFVEKTLKNKFQTKVDGKIPIRRFDYTYILNFNYTNTVENYLNNYTRNAKIINIHGELQSSKNPINLGFGDERNNYYSTIEDHNQNEYLRFMKSFQYTKNNNYKSLFDYIEDDFFQVQIMGHSCGLSDRTLLNAIFEHPNCKSIKVFFHQYDEALDNGETDNHSEVVRNISRHFTQKTNMREKIVNRIRCVELPQWGK